MRYWMPRAFAKPSWAVKLWKDSGTTCASSSLPEPMRFDDRADSYGAHAAPQKRFAEALAAFAPFRRGVRVTELGAGTGFLTAALLAQGVNVDATDASPAMVELGRQAVPVANWSVHNAFGPIEKAGALASTGLLHWAADPAAVLKYWHTALPAGGRLLLGVPCDPCLNELRDLIGEGPVRWRDEAQWLALLKGAKFDVHAHGVLESEEIYPNALEFFRHLHRSGVTGEPRFSPTELKSLLRDYDRLNARPDGVVATWAWLLVDATARG
jgi:SAM-dependent methyltransferase